MKIDNNTKELIDIIVDNYEGAINEIGNILGPLIATHRDILKNNKELEKSLLKIMRIGIKSFGSIKAIRETLNEGDNKNDLD
jgi:hypothetical protein